MSDDDLDARELIVALRGGVPAKCDFCQQEVEPENLHPEEAGEWACIECIMRWEKNAREAKILRDAK